MKISKCYLKNVFDRFGIMIIFRKFNVIKYKFVKLCYRFGKINILMFLLVCINKIFVFIIIVFYEC